MLHYTILYYAVQVKDKKVAHGSPRVRRAQRRRREAKHGRYDYYH